VFLGSIDSPDVTMLFAEYSAVSYVPPGFLLLLRGTTPAANAHTLLAQRFDPEALVAIGAPEPAARSSTAIPTRAPRAWRGSTERARS
jgi:hypothetical protein